MTTKSKSQEKHKMSEIDDHILKYFDIKKRLGKGAYGIVWKAIDKKTNQTLAVKKIFDAFRDETDAQRTFREITFLRAFRNHPNIIQLHNVYKATNNLDIYLSFEFMESDLHNVIKKGNILKDVHKRYIMYQLLNAIKYIHSGNVIHRDLKPSNVLIDTKCRCKLADFGLARSVSNQQIRASNETNEHFDPVLTDYVATRWYRAPEILVASKRYTKGIDMWSLGCILGEMIRGKPIFQGSSTVNQIEKIVSALPDITEQDIRAVGAGFGTALLNKQIPSNNVKSLDDLLIDGTDDGNNLVRRLLVLDPLARLTATEALNHKYVEKFRHSVQETELEVDVIPPFRDDVRLSVTEYRSKLYEIVQQTEKTSTVVKPTCYNRKREPRSNNKSLDSIPSKYVNSDDKIKRSIYRSQERKSYIPHHSNEAIFNSKTTAAVNTSSNNKLIVPPPANGTVPKPQSISSLKNEQSERKVHSMITRPKYFIKPSKGQSSNSVGKNISSPEINTVQRSPSGTRKLLVDKRHSIDGSYDYGEPICPTSYSVNHRNGRDKHNNTLHNSYCFLSKQNQKSTSPSSRMRRSTQNVSHIGHSNNSSSPQQVEDHPLKFEDYTDINGGSNYYEKRLKRLEEQIERHKREVKAFCSEKKIYSKSMTLNRNSEPLYKEKYSTSSGSGKSSEPRPKMINNSHKNYLKQGSSGHFEYLYAGGDDVGYRHEISSKNDNRKPSKII